MGNWNRRWRPRRKYYNYQEPSPSHPRHCTESYSQGVGGNSVPSWEINFVCSMGIPWNKVVVAKKYIYCHDNIIQWNDSAGEEAFYNSKKRYWAEINSIPCDIPPPDPDIYIGEIDWNGYIDPELILDLDQEYFNPEEAKEVERVKIVTQEMHKVSPVESSGWDVNNYYNNCVDPWECSHVEDNRTPKYIAQGWNKWDDPLILKRADNPWEPSYGEGSDTLRDSGWGCNMDKLCGWEQGLNHKSQADNFGKYFDNTWANGCETVGSLTAKGWEEAGNNLQCKKQWGTRIHESKSWNKVDNPWENYSDWGRGSLKCQEWTDCGENYRGWHHENNQNNELKQLDFRRANGHRVLNDSCRKREGPQQQTWRNKSSRFLEDDYGIGRQWKMRGNQNRVSFASRMNDV